MNKQQLTNLLGAGTMASLIIGIGLLLGGNPASSADTAISSSAIQAEVVSADLDNSLEAENAALQAMITSYQAREVEYAAQIELANQTLAEQAGSTYGESEEYEEDEYEEHGDYDEDEDHDEYEAYEEESEEYEEEEEHDDDEYEEHDDEDDDDEEKD